MNKHLGSSFRDYLIDENVRLLKELDRQWSSLDIAVQALEFYACQVDSSMADEALEYIKENTDKS